MNKDCIYYADRRLYEPISACRLALEVSAAGFSFAVRDASDVRLAAGGVSLSFPGSGRRLLERIVRFFETTAPFSSLAFERTDIICLDDRFTVVPGAFFDPQKKADLLGFALGGEVKAEVLSRAIGDAVCIFCAAEDIAGYFAGRSARVEQHHSAGVFLRNALSNALQGRSVHLNVSGGYAQAVVLDGQTPVLINIFRLKRPQDVMYYLLLVTAQTGTDESEADFVFYGQPQWYLGNKERMDRYPGRYRFASRADAAGFSPALDFVAYYDWYNVLNAQL